MYFDDGAVQANRVDPDAYDLSMLQLLEYSIEHSVLGPAICACRRCANCRIAWAARATCNLLRHVQNRIDYVQIRMADVAALLGQAVLDLSVLRFGDLHKRIMPHK